MAQIFHPATNPLSRFSICLAVGAPITVLLLFAAIHRSPYVTRVNTAREQPVPFSHKHHVKSLGIDCRYCHTTVEDGAFAGIPPTQTCMSCHTQIWARSPTLAPVRESARTGRSLRWTRVHDLPDFVYFDHSVHVRQGVGCVTCHGQVDEMPLTWRESTLQMEWCLDCHRHPERYVRPREHVFDMSWKPEDQATIGRELVEEYDLAPSTNCSACHR